MSTRAEIEALEAQIYELNMKLQAMHKSFVGDEVPNYTFTTPEGEISLRAMFGEHQRLLLIHNMGQGCRYCTLWADGFNGLLPHLENALSVVLVSKDPPEIQRRMANARGWRFRLASHAGGDYIREQSVVKDADNMPGAVVYERDGDTLWRKNVCAFGPGDLYCSAWSLLSLAGLGAADWTPQFSYWSRPDMLDDGGLNVSD